MNVAIFAYSRQGAQTALQVSACFGKDDIRKFVPKRLIEPGFGAMPKPSWPFYGSCFSWADVMVFVGSCGIAVRAIAPHIRDKCTDPAVLVVDELGTFMIPLLSGHIGGANDFAYRLAAQLKAIPVITTATDIQGRFAVDAWAAKQGFVIDSMVAAKAVAASILERDVFLDSDFPVISSYPQGIRPADKGDMGICISCYRKTPFAHTLVLIPKLLHLGIGCRKDTPASIIEAAALQVLRQYNIDKRAIKLVVSIDLKVGEQGLLDFCQKYQWPLSLYSAQQLLEVKGDFSASSFVRSITGVDNVCERAAILNADHLIVKKTVINGVTVAIAAENLEVRFE